MYIFQNAAMNLLRNRGRNVLIGVIILAIITTTVIALCINNTSKGIIDDYKQRFGSEVFLSPDLEKFMSAPDGAKTAMLTFDEYVNFADSEHVMEFDMALTQEIASDDLIGVDEVPLSDDGITVDTAGPSGGDPYVNPQMVLKGNTWEDFDTGTRQVIDGRMVEAPDECLVSQELAALNDLSVGDAVSFKGSVLTQAGTLRTVSFKFTISGIYFDTADPYSGRSSRHPASNRRNEVMVLSESVIGMLNPGDHSEVSPRIVLKNPELLSAYEAELRAKGLSDFYNLKTDETGYTRVVGPVEGLRNISITFMLIVLILGSIILLLLSSIAIRERKYEIGVLRAMGMKKNKVAFGLWVESFIITSLCLLIGLGVGAVVSQPVTNTLLAGQIENAQAVADSQPLTGRLHISGMGGSEASSTLPPLAELNVSLGPDTVVEIVVIALLLASVASAASILRITKYEPIKILMERN